MKINKQKLNSVFFITLGMILIIYGLIMCVVSNINLGIVLILFLGIISLFVGIFYNKTEKLKKNKIFRILSLIFIIAFFLEVILISFIAIYGVTDNTDFSEDAVIVLGAGIRGDKVTMPLKMRLDKAVEYHKINPEAIIVVTGGKGFQETVTEAYAMEKYLVRNGVDSKKIIKEERATSTNENMRFSKKILDSHFNDNYSVVVITNNFHILRSVNIAEKNGFKNVAHFHAGLQWYNLMPCYLRESLAVLKMLVFD